MPYVRPRLQPASKKYARLRAARNRVALAARDAVGWTPGARFTGAFDWFRAASAYAQRRSYRTREIRERALSRHEQITAEAARMLRQHAAEMDAVVPPPRKRVRRLELRQACDRAATDAARMEAARQRFLFLAAQARRERGETAAQADAIQDRAASRLIQWAEEMDADDYGE